jgi:hypothetical protein
MLLKLLTSGETYHLRQQVLRPNRQLQDCVFPGDELAETFHVGAFVNGKLVGVATYLMESLATFKAENPYRLRGMAVYPEFQTSGVGRSIFSFGIIELQRQQVDFVWCNAREKAFGFYEKMGLSCHGPIFEITGTGPHKVMYKYL